MKRFSHWLFKRMYRKEIAAAQEQLRRRLRYEHTDARREAAIWNSAFGMIDALEYLDLY